MLGLCLDNTERLEAQREWEVFKGINWKLMIKTEWCLSRRLLSIRRFTAWTCNSFITEYSSEQSSSAGGLTFLQCLMEMSILGWYFGYNINIIPWHVSYRCLYILSQVHNHKLRAHKGRRSPFSPRVSASPEIILWSSVCRKALRGWQIGQLVETITYLWWYENVILRGPGEVGFDNL